MEGSGKVRTLLKGQPARQRGALYGGREDLPDPLLAEHGGAPTMSEPFRSLAIHERALLLSKCDRRTLARGAGIFRQGERHALNFIVCSGLVRTFFTSATGKEITLFYWSDGDLIGGPHFLDSAVGHTWSARAVTESTLLAISPEDLEALVMRSPGVARFVIESLTVKLTWVSGLLQGFGTQSVVFRLGNLLVKLAEMYGVPSERGIMIRHHFTQEDLANMVGATRQWVSTMLRQLQRDDILSTVNGRLHIRDLDVLRRRVALSSS